MRQRISSGSPFETAAGYSRVVVEDDQILVSGTTGFDYATMQIDSDLIAQTHQAMHNIASALALVDASLDDVIRVRYFLTAAGQFERVAPLFGAYFARARPAATAVIVGLIDARMKIEIEVTARRRAKDTAP